MQDDRKSPRWILVTSLVLVALNLRPALASVSPVLADIQRTLGLSASAAGVLTTLPVLCLGVFAPLAARLERRFDAERVVLGTLIVLAAGTALRGVAGAMGLLAGAMLAGASIGVIGVLLPPIVKREFGQGAGTMMGLYTMALCLGAAFAAGGTVPLRDLFGGDWRPALMMWGVPALVAAAAWWPQLRMHTTATRLDATRPLWRDRLAWAVTLYMGLQSSLAYCVFGWLPVVLVDRGVSPLDAGLLLSQSVLLQLVTAFSAPWLATRIGRDQRPVLALLLALPLIGMMGMLHAPLQTLPLWAVLLGSAKEGSLALRCC